MRNLIIVFTCALPFPIHAANFTIINGQIFTPGLAIIDAPQPDTPLGGDTLQVALDISGDGKLPLPPYPANAPTAIHNITIFLSSYVTGLNLTITNGTASSGNASLGDILYQEPGSTVKHVNWIWPDCFVGNGPPADSSSARGSYNITIHQSFTLNATTYYTIFALPISITNAIPATATRPNCSLLANPLLSQAQLDASADTIPAAAYPWTGGRGAQTVIPDAASTAATAAAATGGTGGVAMMTATAVGTGIVVMSAGMGTGGTSSSSGNSGSAATSAPAFGDPKPDATPEDGLGAGAGLRPPDVAMLVLVLGLTLGLLWVYV